MSVETVKQYADTMAAAIKSRSYTDLMTTMAEDVDVHATIMGKSYEFQGPEKLEKFLNSMPAGVSVDVKDVTEGDNGYLVKVSMGVGFMKMPGKWTVGLNADGKINKLIIQ